MVAAVTAWSGCALDLSGRPYGEAPADGSAPILPEAGGQAEGSPGANPFTDGPAGPATDGGPSTHDASSAVADAGSPIELLGCADLAAMYATELPKSRTCNAAVANTCTTTRTTVLGCGCPTSVNVGNTSVLDAIIEQWNEEECVVPCAGPTCDDVQSGTCSSTTQRCQDGSGTTT
jgi:hypothetical protein